MKGTGIQTDSNAKRSVNSLSHLVLLCFFLSGLSSLIYEIIWMRLMEQVIGAAPFAVSIVLVIFMGGLGLGGYLAGPMADRFRPSNLVRIYGILELIVGVYALLIPWLLKASNGIFAPLYNGLFDHTILYHVLVFGICLVILCVPVICMGATLPILCKFYVNSLGHLGERSGRLYGLNTLGAALGSLLCGFWLIGHWGVWGTIWFAVSINGLIGLACLLAVPGEVAPDDPQKATRTVPPEPLAASTSAPEEVEMKGALILFGVSGFCAMAYEVIWTKLIGLMVGPTTYAFTIVLVTFIVGLALGNLVFGRLADRSRDPVRLLLLSQMAAALLALVVSHWLGNSQFLFAKLIFTLRDNFTLLNMAKALVLFCLMIFPTFCLGGAFPLTAKIYTRRLSGLGKKLGFAYAVNTLGAVSGSFCAGFLLVPLVGKATGLRFTIGLQLAVGCLVGMAVLHHRKTRWAKRGWPAIVLACGLALCVLYPSWNRKLLAIGKYHRFEEIKIAEVLKSTGWISAFIHGAEVLGSLERGEMVYYGDGIGGFTTVSKYPGPMGTYEYTMANSGKADASSRGDMKTQTLLAHFPMLFCSDPKTVMVLGMASGITAGEVLHYPIERMDVLDINDRVFDASRFFNAWNNKVLANPKTRAIIQDGRAHLALTRQMYDVIISEPSNPWMAGMASLFTRDFYALARERLNTGGMYVQWVHCYQMNWPTFAMMGRTFVDVFPESLLVSAEPSGAGRDYLLVGFNGRAGLDPDAARKSLAWLQRSRNVRLRDPAFLLRLIVNEDLPDLFGPGPIHTDAHPLLEYAAPRLMHQGDRALRSVVSHILGHRRLSAETLSYQRRELEDVDAQIDFADYAFSVNAPFRNMVDLTRATPDQRRRFKELVAAYSARNPMNCDLLDDPESAGICRQVQIETIQKEMEGLPDKPLSLVYMARLQLAKGRGGAAIADYTKAVELEPDNAEYQNDLGFLLFQQGRTDAAIEHYTSALALRPTFVLAHGNLAQAYLNRGQLDEALNHFRETLHLRPDLAESQYYVGYILFKKGRSAEAVSELKKTLALKPEAIEALNLLSWVLATTKDSKVNAPEDAVGYARKACELTAFKDPLQLYALSTAYAADHEKAKAIDTGESALRIAKQSGRRELADIIENHLFFLY